MYHKDWWFFDWWYGSLFEPRRTGYWKPWKPWLWILRFRWLEQWHVQVRVSTLRRIFLDVWTLKNGRLLGGVPFFSFRGSGFLVMETWVVLSKNIFVYNPVSLGKWSSIWLAHIVWIWGSCSTTIPWIPGFTRCLTSLGHLGFALLSFGQAPCLGTTGSRVARMVAASAALPVLHEHQGGEVPKIPPRGWRQKWKPLRTPSPWKWPITSGWNLKITRKLKKENHLRQTSVFGRFPAITCQGPQLPISFFGGHFYKIMHLSPIW